MDATILKNAKPIPRDIAIGTVNTDLLFRFRGKQSCIEKAMARPLPGAAGKAFTTGAIKAAGKVVNRVVPAHFAILQAVNSPILVMIENAMTKKKSDVDFKPQEQWDICFIFTEDAEIVYTLLENDGAKSVQSASKKAVGMKWDAAAVNLVMLAVLEQVKRHIETTVKFAGEMESQGDISFFRERPESP